MFILFYVQAVWVRGTKTEKGLLDDMRDSKMVIAILALQYNPAGQKTTSLLFKEQRPTKSSMSFSDCYMTLH